MRLPDAVVSPAVLPSMLTCVLPHRFFPVLAGWSPCACACLSPWLPPHWLYDRLCVSPSFFVACLEIWWSSMSMCPWIWLLTFTGWMVACVNAPPHGCPMVASSHGVNGCLGVCTPLNLIFVHEWIILPLLGSLFSMAELSPVFFCWLIFCLCAGCFFF